MVSLVQRTKRSPNSPSGNPQVVHAHTSSFQLRSYSTPSSRGSQWRLGYLPALSSILRFYNLSQLFQIATMACRLLFLASCFGSFLGCCFVFVLFLSPITVWWAYCWLSLCHVVVVPWTCLLVFHWTLINLSYLILSNHLLFFKRVFICICHFSNLTSNTLISNLDNILSSFWRPFKTFQFHTNHGNFMTLLHLSFFKILHFDQGIPHSNNKFILQTFQNITTSTCARIEGEVWSRSKRKSSSYPDFTVEIQSLENFVIPYLNLANSPMP